MTKRLSMEEKLQNARRTNRRLRVYLREFTARLAQRSKDNQIVGHLLARAEDRAHIAEQELKMRPVAMFTYDDDVKPRFRMKARTVRANPLDGARLWSNS